MVPADLISALTANKEKGLIIKTLSTDRPHFAYRAGKWTVGSDCIHGRDDARNSTVIPLQHVVAVMFEDP